MQKLKEILNYRLLCIAFILVYVGHFCFEKSNFDHTITSDGEGYYAYLPALYLLGDKTFEANAQAKFEHTKQKDYYVILTDQGKYVNKYFSGVSLLATPAFLVITAVQNIFGSEPDGYNESYFIGMFFYSIFLLLIGFILYYSTVSKHYALKNNQKWVFLVALITTPWLFTALYGILWANNYLFICFSVALWLIIKLIQSPERPVFILSFFFLTGIVAITRPTSLVFLVMVLFFFDNFGSFFNYLKSYVLKPKILLSGLILFLLPISYQFAMWKWQTGSFFLWSYSSEGFNWFNPQFFEVFFGYRIGILFHSPVLLFCLLYCVLTFRKSPYKAVVYLVYFFLICYVSASWWGYDFETKYGLRNFNEHYVFLLLPLFDFARSHEKKKWLFVLLIPAIVLPLIRFNQYVFGINTNQRFTQHSYWKSLAFWNNTKDRFTFYHSVKPFGKLYSSEVLLKEDYTKITPEDEYYLGKTVPMKLKMGERIFVKVSYDRNFLGKYRSKPPVFVIDFYNKADKNIRFYQALSGYEDAQQESEHVEITRACFDYYRNMDEITVFFWNLDHSAGELKNVKIEFEKYGPH
jgi:hypothetical protein